MVYRTQILPNRPLPRLRVALAGRLRGGPLRDAAGRQLSREQLRIQTTLNSISDAVIGANLRGQIDYLNTAAIALTGWSRELAYGRPADEVFCVADAVSHAPRTGLILQVLASGVAQALPSGMVLIRHDGSEVAIEDAAAPIYDIDGTLSGVVVVCRDVSAAQALNARMAHQAQHDFLTQLPNRALLNERIGRAIALARRNGTLLTVLFLDLDNFKYINDSLGHGTGDILLQLVAQRLSECVRGSDTVSRQGGDEFVALLAESHHEGDAQLAAAKMLASLATPYRIASRELHISASIGISRYPDDGGDAETLVKNADTAMYHAKESGRNNYQFFDRDMNLRAIERQSIEASLRGALQQCQFILHFQPKVDLASGHITGAEALLRWRHHELGTLLPERFIGIAEESGLIVPIGRWVLRAACLQARRWREAGLPALPIAVNISALEFRQRDFFDSVRATLLETAMPPHQLQLEITETVLMRDVESSAAVLGKLTGMGIQLAIDDFGTGYSSLSYLRLFPIDVLKIDRSFVHDIDAGADRGIIVGAVIGMGNNMGLKVIAEGIETPAQLAFLQTLECAEGQGYYFSHPLEAAEFVRLLARGLPPP
jgi:diguanylate cyclase (GGDEF)-like protein/PAS domain S-box-containing protein